jgi:hypothetical protein
MRITFRLAVVLLMTTVASSAIAETPASQTSKPQPRSRTLPNLLVFDIIPEKGVEKGAANLLTELVMDRISDTKKYTVFGQKDLDKMLFWEQNKQLKGCTDTACLVQIAGAMGAEFYVEGSIGVMGDKYVFTLKLIDAMTVKVTSRATETIPKDEAEAMNSARRMVREIMGVDQAAQKSYPMNPYKMWGHVSFWSGLGAVAVGGAMSGLAKNSSDSYRRSGNSSDKERVGTYDTTAAVMYGLGGAMVVTGIVLWSISPGDEAWAKRHRVSFAPSFGPDGVGAAIGGVW